MLEVGGMEEMFWLLEVELHDINPVELAGVVVS